jgi:hypothetical protein
MNTSNTHRPFVVTGMCLILAALACNAPGAATPTTAPPAPTEPPVAEASSTPSPPPSATSAATTAATTTPVPDVSGPGGCTLNASYVADVTVPDNTKYTPGATFTKVWRLRNSGTCTWETGSQLAFVSGEPLGGPAAVDVSPVTPGSNTDVSVDLIAPDTPGTYRSTWQLQGPDGVRFGSQVYVQIVVPAPATATPTPTEEPEPPDLVITKLKIDTDDPRQGVPLQIIATLHNQGDSTAENVHWAWRVCVHDDCEYTEAPGAFTLEPDEKVTAQMEYLFEGWATYTTEAWVDSSEEIDESDEDNNTRELEIAVQPGLPDLIIKFIEFDPDPPTQGEDTTIEVKIRNRGPQPADAFIVEWWASVNAPAPACEWTLSGGLADEASVTLDCTHTYPSWYSKITTRAIVDVNDEVDELDESNNSLEQDTQVRKP